MPFGIEGGVLESCRTECEQLAVEYASIVAQNYAGAAEALCKKADEVARRIDALHHLPTALVVVANRFVRSQP